MIFLQIFLLPTVIFVVAKLISVYLLFSHFGIFDLPIEFILTKIVLIAALAFVHFGLKLRTRYDLVVYILLFVLALVWLEEFQYLREIII